MMRLGTDLADIDLMRIQIDESQNDFVAAFLSPSERTEVGADVGRIATRWAAKEATMKALGHGFGDLDPRDIEVTVDEHGRPGLVLRGRAAALANEIGVVHWELSLSRTAGIASAVVIGTGR